MIDSADDPTDLFRAALTSPRKALEWLDNNFPAHKRLSPSMARKVRRLRKNLLALIRAERLAARPASSVSVGP
jgi:hypothetical protein